MDGPHPTLPSTASARTGKGSINLLLTHRPGLEASVHPIILLGHFTHAVFDEGVHAAGVGFEIIAWKIVPCGIEFDHITCTAVEDTAHAGHDPGVGGAREPGYRGDGRRK